MPGNPGNPGTAGTAGVSGDVSINVTKNGVVSGGSGVGRGVYIDQAAAATITNAGTISALSGNAIYAAGNTATVGNTGTINGNVTLNGATSAAFNNNAGGVFNSGSTINLGTNGTLTNAGTLAIGGGNGAISTTNVTGNFVQTSTGVLSVRANWTGNSGTGVADQLAVSGTARLAGTVLVNPVNFPAATASGLVRTFPVLSAAGGVTNNGITIANTAAVNYALLFAAKVMSVQATINFQAPTPPTQPVTRVSSTPPPSVGLNGLTLNQYAIGGSLNGIFGGGTTLGFMPAFLALPTTGQLSAGLNQLAPVNTGGQASSVLTTGSNFAGQLMSCRVAGEEGEVTRYIREGQCVWARINARWLESDGRADGLGYRENATFFSAGAQLKVAPDWRVGGGIGYETLNLTATSASSSGERLHVGSVVKYNPGPWLFAAALTGGFGWHDNVRHVAVTGFDATATSSNESSYFSGRLTAAYLLSRGMFYAKPQVDLAATSLWRDGYTEHASGDIGLAVRKSSDTVLSASPSLEIGAEGRSASGFVTRAFVKGGATFRDTDTFVTTASFASAPSGIAPFAISTRIDKITADIGAGVDLISPNDTALRLTYDGQFGEYTTQHAGGAKLSVSF